LVTEFPLIFVPENLEHSRLRDLPAQQETRTEASSPKTPSTTFFFGEPFEAEEPKARMCDIGHSKRDRVTL